MPRYSSIATIEARINALQAQAQRLEQSALKGDSCGISCDRKVWSIAV
jgi:hypothetical protein